MTQLVTSSVNCKVWGKPKLKRTPVLWTVLLRCMWKEEPEVHRGQVLEYELFCTAPVKPSLLTALLYSISQLVLITGV